MLRLDTLLFIIIIVGNIFITINTHQLSLCESLDDIEKSEVKKRHIRALCDAIYPLQDDVSESNDLDDNIPDFDLTQIQSDNDANQILKRFRRGIFSRSGSSSSSRFGSSSRSSSSSSRGSSGLFSRSSSSSGSSRIFSRSGSSSSSSTGSGSRIFSRTPSSSSSGHRVRETIRTVVRKPTSSGIFSRSSSMSSNAGRQHRVREAVRSLFRSSSRSQTPGYSYGTGGVSGGSKPSLSDKIRKITHSGGTGSRFSSGVSGSGFSSGTGGGSGGSAWVRAGKKFLPVAVRFGKRYYQRRKYSKGMYAGIGAGAGYYAGSRMGTRYYGQQYPNDYYGYPPTVEEPPERIDGKPPSVFYCIQEDLNTTLVNATLNNEGMGVCNISGELVDCPIEIECQMSEADSCCEDDRGVPYCCGGQLPEEYASQYGGYGDDMDDAAHSFNNILNIITTISLVLATICFTMWRRHEH